MKKGFIKNMEWRCLKCEEKFSISDRAIDDDDDLYCPYCGSSNIDPYSGEF
jgi:DNA-directed RNA polymerase subunit RPC12/RpoP